MSQKTKPRAGRACRGTRGSLWPWDEHHGGGFRRCPGAPRSQPPTPGRALCVPRARGESGSAAQTHRPALPVEPCSCGPSWESFEISLVEAHVRRRAPSSRQGREEPTLGTGRDRPLPTPGSRRLPRAPGWSSRNHTLAISGVGLGCSIPSVKDFGRSWGAGSWRGVVSARFEQSLAKPSPRLILIRLLRGAGDAIRAGDGGGDVPARAAFHSPHHSLLPIPLARPLPDSTQGFFCCLARI